jgi:NAD(P)-dependent dehydrogenase (short-subunit alcohol dehydrogenase family)
MGTACALTLAETVDVVLLTDLDGDRLASTAERISKETGATVCSLTGDLGEPAFVGELAARAQSLGRLHSLVHTAGLSPSMAPWAEILRVDLVATARVLDVFLASAVPGSVAVCLGSLAGHVGPFEPGMDAVLDGPLDADLESRFQALAGAEPGPGVTYRGAKRGVIRLCERAAIAWGVRGGRVVSVSPGLIDTAMGRLELQNNPIKRWMAERTPVGGGRSEPGTLLPGLTRDVADAVAFLCSDKASFISGCDVRVDGGLTAALNAEGNSLS